MPVSGSSPTDRLSDGFVPSQMPPAAPDGGPILEPATTDPIPVAPISVCELGPCRRYHRLASKIDAQEPLDGSRVHLPVFITRTCYPTSGIEFHLDQPIKECSLWDPLNKADIQEIADNRASFARAHADQMDAFNKSWEDDDARR